MLTAKAMDAHSTVDNPAIVTPANISAKSQANALELRVPPKSVTVVRLQ